MLQAVGISLHSESHLLQYGLRKVENKQEVLYDPKRYLNLPWNLKIYGHAQSTSVEAYLPIKVKACATLHI